MSKSIKRNNSLASVLVCIALLAGLVYASFPVFWMFFCSLKSNTEIFSLPPKLLPKVFTLSAYKAIFSNSIKLRYFFNSYFVALSVTFIGKKFLNIFIITTQTIPPITLLIPYFGMLVSFRLYNTYFALIFTYMVFTLPYAVLMMTGYFNTLPKELDEAVLVDGGSCFLALWKVLVPVSIPGIIATGVYTFLLSWNEFLFALTLTKTNEMRTVPIGIQQLMGQHAYEWNEMMAMSLLGCLPVLLMYLFAQRYFLDGMTAGSVKS